MFMDIENKESVVIESYINPIINEGYSSKTVDTIKGLYKDYGFNKCKVNGNKLTLTGNIINITLNLKKKEYFINILGGYRNNFNDIAKIVDSLNKCIVFFDKVKEEINK